MILVTGGTGLLGSHVLYELVRNNKPVRAFCRNRERIAFTREIFRYYEKDDQAFDRIEWAEADINNYHSLVAGLNDVTLVFHTAGYVSFNDRERKKLNKVNAGGTANVVNACLEYGIRKLCHVSSIATLGELADGIPVSETELWNQGATASAYAFSKYKAEMEVWRGIHEGLNAVIVNPSVIIGPGMWLGPGKQLWQSIQKGLRFYPSGSTGYVDVRDVAAILFRLSNQEISGERFILNAGQMKHKEFLSILAESLNARKPDIRATSLLSQLALTFESVRAFITISDKRFNRRTIKIASENLSYSNEKISKLLGVTFIPVEESVTSAVRIFRNQINKKT